MIDRHATLFITHRGERHQADALASAPPDLDITMLRSPSKEEIISLLPGKEFLISERSGEIDADIVKAGKDLRLIQRLGSLTYDIDLESARSAGIAVSYLPVRSCIMVAEHMMMQILASAKRLNETMELTIQPGDWSQQPKRCDEDYFAYNWTNRKDIHALWEATVGILGFGEIGAELARRLRGFNCQILYNKRTPLPPSAELDLNIQYAGMDQLLAESDYICMLLPYFPETDQSLSSEFFKKMKPGSVFVSCGGSAVVDEDALAESLNSGHLYGAAMDTFTYEPITSDSSLISIASQPLSNLYLTPHTAAGSGSSNQGSGRERYGDYINIIRSLNGEKLTGRLV
jgi:phosphoglycerate dehydrogenase-like enzyme